MSTMEEAREPEISTMALILAFLKAENFVLRLLGRGMLLAATPKLLTPVVTPRTIMDRKGMKDGRRRNEN
jgi:hypothetical protein